MRRLLPLFSILAIAALVPGAATAAPFDDDDYSNVRIVRLSLVDGQAQVFRPEQGEWEDALVNLPIQKAYAVATGRGRVEVEFESGATVRLDEFTELEFTELALVGGARVTRLRLERGSAFLYANLDKNDTFEILTGSYRVKVPRNARLRVDVTGDDLIVSVLKGDAEVTSDRGSYRLTKNQELYFAPGGEPQLARRGESTEFERWSLDREEVLTASRHDSQRYVDSSLSYGVSDLSRHGYWYNHSSYGNVWQPYAVGFVPYVNGNWIWVNGFGWSWVGHEPWGWLPYHYGRWVWTGYGWAWVPSHFRSWRPAHVAWLRLGDGSFGWCPLGPRDRPGRRPTHAGVVTAVMTGGQPTVRTGPLPSQPVVAQAPTRDELGAHPRFGGRTDPAIQRAGRGGDSEGTPATARGPRNGFSGSTPVGDAPPRAGQDENSTGRMPQPRGDVRFDRNEDKYVNTPMREPPQAAEDTPRSGWTGSAARPQPRFPRGEGPRASEPRNPGAANDGSATGTPPRSSGFTGRTPPTSGQRPDAPPRAAPAPPPPRSTSQPSQSRPAPPPPRATPPPQARPSVQPRPSSPPPASRPAPPPPRPAPQATRPAPAPRPAPQSARPPKQPARPSFVRPSSPAPRPAARPAPSTQRPSQPTRRPAPAPKRPSK